MQNPKIELTLTQCKQLVSNDVDLREFVEQLNDQPDFMNSTGMQIDSISELQSILQCGCAGNAHRSVFYYEASQCMAEYGDSVIQYLEDNYGELPTIPTGSSWSQIASFYLTCAIESWCYQFSDALHGVDWD